MGNSPMTIPDRSVLLIAGASGIGKTTVAKQIANDLGVARVQVNDLRLALLHSDARLPDDVATDDLYFLLRTPDICTLPGLLDHPELRGFVASGALRMVELAPASESELLYATVARGRGQRLDPDASETRRIPAMDWRFSRWPVAEAETRRIPVVSTQPWESLAARILAM